MAAFKFVLRLSPDIRRQLDKRIIEMDYPSIPELYRWLLDLSTEKFSLSNFRRYMDHLKEQPVQISEEPDSAFVLLKPPVPADMPEPAIFGELGNLSYLAHVISARIAALHRELDARHAAEAMKRAKPGGSGTSRPGGL